MRNRGAAGAAWGKHKKWEKARRRRRRSAPEATEITGPAWLIVRCAPHVAGLRGTAATSFEKKQRCSPGPRGCTLSNPRTVPGRNGHARVRSASGP
eukprot:gene9394-biopygen13767